MRIRDLTVFLIVPSLISIFQACGSGFTTQTHEEFSSGLRGADEQTQVDGPGVNTPPLQEPPPPVTSPPVTGGSSSRPSVPLDELKSYLPEISESQCSSTTPVQDPFPGKIFNRKTVCATGCDFASVSAAFSGAQPYDEIVIQDGDHVGCLQIKASPVIVRAENEMVNLDARNCKPAIDIFSQQIKLSGFNIQGEMGAALSVRPSVEFADLRNFWFEGMGSALGGMGSANAVVILRNFKVKNVGVLTQGYHTHGVISVDVPTLIVANGVFSHHKDNSYPVASNSRVLEFLCNVAIRGMNMETGIFFHFGNLNEKLIFRNNYFMQNELSKKEYSYLPRASPTGTSVILEDNVFINEVSGAYFLNGPIEANIESRGNLYVGGSQFLMYQKKPIDLEANKYFSSRDQAGLGPYPAVSKDWPLPIESL